MIGVADLSIPEPGKPLQEGVFTVAEGEADGTGQAAHRWLRVSAVSGAASDQEARGIVQRVRISPDFVTKAYAVVAPGTTLVITTPMSELLGREPREAS